MLLFLSGKSRSISEVERIAGVKEEVLLVCRKGVGSVPPPGIVDRNHALSDDAKGVFVHNGSRSLINPDPQKLGPPFEDVDEIAFSVAS